MKRFSLSTGALLLGASLLLPVQAQGQYVDAATFEGEHLVNNGAIAPTCNPAGMTFTASLLGGGSDVVGYLGEPGLSSFFDCRGAFYGNNEGMSQPPETEVVAYINEIWSLGLTVGADFPGIGDSSVDWPFSGTFDPDGGSLAFVPGLTGPFVLALKQSKYFSLYKFDTSTNTWEGLEFSTAGVSLVNNAELNQYSHATLYYRGTTVVPEPAGVLLLLSGLAGVGAVAWRRREGLEE